MGNQTVFEIITEPYRAINTTGSHPYLVRGGGYILNLNGVSTNNLPLKSDGLILSNKSDNNNVVFKDYENEEVVTAKWLNRCF